MNDTPNPVEELAKIAASLSATSTTDIDVSYITSTFNEVLMTYTPEVYSEIKDALASAINSMLQIARTAAVNNQAGVANEIYAKIKEISEKATKDLTLMYDILEELNPEELNDIFADGSLIHMAAHQNQKNIVEYLLSKGANPTIIRPSGHSAISITMSKDNYLLCHLIIKDQLAKRPGEKIGIINYLKETCPKNDGPAKVTIQKYIAAFNEKLEKGRSTKRDGSGDVTYAAKQHQVDNLLDDDDFLTKLMSEIRICEEPRRRIQVRTRYTNLISPAGAAAGSASVAEVEDVSMSAHDTAPPSSQSAAEATASEEAAAKALEDQSQPRQQSHAKRLRSAVSKITAINTLGGKAR